MTKIYTKKGDKGKTTVCGMEVEKNHPRLVVLGVLDELSSSLGVVLAFSSELKILSEIQEDLMEIGSEIALGDRNVGGKLEQRVIILEKEIDQIWEDLPPLVNFILPQGGKVGSLLHFSRSICRRAEREAVILSQKEKIAPEIIIYLNRLSDFLFALARWVNKNEGFEEKIWP
ncbi:cob(I)yrinic acid a,c-diamide adenosyltransferase [Candidatus Microgenomates bacterium]|nr:cob(I)yrinic acid a,c-diamide adenosyltransferase [Candidatus Microgenomates bacterium]